MYLIVLRFYEELVCTFPNTDINSKLRKNEIDFFFFEID